MRASIIYNPDATGMNDEVLRSMDFTLKNQNVEVCDLESKYPGQAIELVKKAKGYCEEYKVTVRNIRRDSMDSLKKDDTYTEDTRKRAENDIQKVTDEAIVKIDKVYKEKELEIMSI